MHSCGQENPYKENVFESKEYQNLPMARIYESA